MVCDPGPFRLTNNVTFRSGRPIDIKLGLIALFDCPYPIYTDASDSNLLYQALGMTRRSVEGGPESSKGDYLDGVTASELIKYGLKVSITDIGHVFTLD